jgi:DNA-binding beta-propeller fold protein YncE
VEQTKRDAKMNIGRKVLSVILFSSAGIVFAAPGGGSLPKVIDTLVVGGTGGWDYVSCDPQARRLYVSHENRVEVVDIDARKKVGEIANTNGVHGIALAVAEGRGFTSNGKDNSVTVFSLKTLAVEKVIPGTGKKPDAILYEPRTHRVLAFNGGTENVTVVDAKTLDVAGTLALGGTPESAVADESGMVYVNIENKNEVVVFDAASLTIKSRWPIAPGGTPTGMAMDLKNRRLFIGGRNQTLVIMDADNGTVVANFPIGKGVDAVSFDPSSGLIGVSNKDGSFDVVKETGPNEFTVLGKVQTLQGAKTHVLDAVHHTYFFPAARTPGGEMILIVAGM